MNPMNNQNEQSNQNNQIKSNKSEIKQYMHCIDNYFPFKTDHLSVEKGQLVYVMSVVDDLCFISNGRKNGYVAKKALFEPDVTSEQLIVVQPVAIKDEIATPSQNLTEMNLVSNSVPNEANVEYDESNHLQVIHDTPECLIEPSANEQPVTNEQPV